MKKSYYGYDFEIRKLVSETDDTYTIFMIDKNDLKLKVGQIIYNYEWDKVVSVTYIVDCEPLDLHIKFDEYQDELNKMIAYLIRHLFMPEFDAEKVNQYKGWGYKFHQFNKHDVIEQHARFEFSDNAILLDSTDNYAFIKFEKSPNNWEYVTCGHDFQSFFWGHYFFADEPNAYQQALSDFNKRK